MGAQAKENHRHFLFRPAGREFFSKMGASQSVYDRTGQLRIYEPPYGYQRVLQFPYKFFFQNSMFLRTVVAGWIIVLPICLAVQRTVNTPANKAHWKEARLTRRHTFFDPPQPVEFPKQPPHWW